MGNPFNLKKLAPTGVCDVDSERIYACGASSVGGLMAMVNAAFQRAFCVTVPYRSRRGFGPFNFICSIACGKHRLHFDAYRFGLSPLLRRITAIELADERLRL